MTAKFVTKKIITTLKKSSGTNAKRIDHNNLKYELPFAFFLNEFVYFFGKWKKILDI